MRRAWRDLAELSRQLKAMLEDACPGDVRKLALELTGDTLTISGEVASERSRSSAKRLALSFDGIFKVRNELEVAGYLAPATDDLDAYFGEGNEPSGRQTPTRRRKVGSRADRRDPPTAVPDLAPAARPVEVVRQPRVAKDGELSPGNHVDLIVDLSSEMTDGGARVVVGRFARDWVEILVSVQLFAGWASQIEAIEPAVLLLPDGSSRPAVFKCLVSADHVAGSPAHVLVSFAHGVRQCGSLNVDVGADAAMEPVAPATPPTTFATPVAISPETAGPTLSINIFSSGTGRQLWMWRALVPGGIQESNQELDRIDDEAAFAEALLRDTPGLASDRHRRIMRGIGERLWQRAPSEFRSAFLSWRTLLPEGFPIQFVTDDPHVPWELMKPDVEGADHLFLEHPVARWPMHRARPRRATLGPHVGDEATAVEWTRRSNDLIARVIGLYPEWFAGACALPQSPGSDMSVSIEELRRCVEELGFVGCNLNPDPGGGSFSSPPLTDRYWYPFYEENHAESVRTGTRHTTVATRPVLHCWWARLSHDSSSENGGLTNTSRPDQSSASPSPPSIFMMRRAAITGLRG